MVSSLVIGRLYTFGVSLLIALIAYPSQIFLFIPAFDNVSTAFKVLIPLNLLVIMVYWNYYLAVQTDPGRVPIEWVDKIPESILIPCNEERRAEGITGPRFCKTCDIYKPPRTHHCRYCRRCVLKMDHHCPWINNCVGYFNYAHFVRFTLYVNIACLYILILLIWRIHKILNDLQHFRFDSEPNTAQVILYVVEFALSFCVFFCVGMLSAYHLYCVTQNQSTIEGWERSKVTRLIRRKRISPVKYPFDIGFYRNICSVMGDNPLLWLWPQQARGDGLSFPVRPNTDPEIPFYWPPRDPDELRPSIFSNRYHQQQQQQIHGGGEVIDNNNNNNNSEDYVDSDEYYDSGSLSDSDYSISDEEERLRQPVMRMKRQYRRVSNHKQQQQQQQHPPQPISSSSSSNLLLSQSPPLMEQYPESNHHVPLVARNIIMKKDD